MATRGLGNSVIEQNGNCFCQGQVPQLITPNPTLKMAFTLYPRLPSNPAPAMMSWACPVAPSGHSPLNADSYRDSSRRGCI